MSWFDALFTALGFGETGTPSAVMEPAGHWARRHAEMAAVGWTRERFVTARRETEARVDDMTLDQLWMASWDLSWSSPPLRPGLAEANGKTRVIWRARPPDVVLMAVWRGLAEDRLERALSPHVHGFRRGHSCWRAVATLTRVPFTPQSALVHADVRAMFPSLRHDVLLQSAVEVWGDDALGRRLVGQVRRWLDAWGQGVGVPTGVSVSPMLSNAYFATGVDRWMAARLSSGFLSAGVRYADDFAFVTEQPHEALADLSAALSGCGLALNDKKTTIVGLAGPWPVRLLGVPVRESGGRLRADGRQSPPRTRLPGKNR